MKTGLFLLLLLSLFTGRAQTNIIRTGDCNLDNGVALKGYDPVSYFARNKAEKGKKEFSLSDQGVIYHFATQNDLDMFRSSPSKYEPQYGGWCAYAMGHDGTKVEVDPETFKILDGKLFLFYNRFFNNTLKAWNQDESNLRKKADVNWQKNVQQSLKTSI